MLEPWSTPPQFVAVPGDAAARAAPRAAGAGGAAVLPFPGAGAGAGGVGFTRTIPPVNEVRPPAGTDFIVGGELAGATAATTPAVVPGVTFTVPLGSKGYVRSITLQVQNVLVTSVIRWALRDNAGAVPGWQSIPTLSGAIAVWSQSWGPDEVYVPIEPGHTVDVSVTVTDGAAYTVGAIIHGWVVPIELANASERGWSL